MSDRKVVLTGATGMIGRLVQEYCLSDSSVGSVTSVGRRTTDTDHPKLREIAHGDFTDFSSIEEEMEGQDAAFFCLGAYTGAVPDDEFRKITVDYTVAFAEALVKGSPEAAFCLLSGAGADQSEKSRISFARYKGMAENALLAQGFARVHIFRPAYIYPTQARPEPNITYRIMRMLYPAVRPIFPNMGISSEDLAKAMFHAGLAGTPGHDSPILENRDIRRLAEKIA